MEAKLYNQIGKEAGSVTLPEAVFGNTWNADLVHQVVTSMMSSARAPIAHAKTRAEVRGGGRKPWQQKGLGRARHGSSRSPIWVGGGTTHGPRNDKNFFRKVNKKMKAKALSVILSKKLKDQEIIFIDTLSFAAPKTKDAVGVVKSLAGIKGFERLNTKKVNAAFIALPKKNRIVERSFSNMSNIEVGEIRNMNPLHVLNHKYIIIAEPKESFTQLTRESK